MKWIVSRPELAEIIGKIQNVVSSKPPMAIAANVLIEAREGTITLTATDLTLTMRAELPAQIEEEGTITLPARRFFQLVRELRSPEIELSLVSNEIAHLKAGSSQFRLLGMNSNAFPDFPDLGQGESFSISSELLKDFLTRTAFASAREDSRKYLNGVFLMIEHGVATFVGTDGKRISKLETPLDIPDEISCRSIIPIKTVEEVMKCLESDFETRITLMPDKIAFENKDMMMVTTLLEGPYPDYERIILKNFTHQMKLHREELMSLLKQLVLFTPDKTYSINFTFSPGELIIEAVSPEIGEGRASMPVDFSGTPLQIFVNPFAFQDILRHSKDETIDFAILAPHEPTLITDSSGAKFGIMPMRNVFT